MDTIPPLSSPPWVKPRLSIRQILEPASIAVVGASDSRAKFGGRIMYHLVHHGFAGDLVPINRGRPEVLGRTAYATLADVPTPPEVAILAVPGETLVQNVAAAATAGVGCCVIISTGFAEASEEGAAMQAEMVAIARQSGMRIVGPNCMGLIVPHHRMPLCSSVVLDTDRLLSGSIGLISQSGALMVSVFDRASTDGIGFRHCVSLGNQADLEICDFLEVMVEDPETKAICLYVEGLKDGARFRAAAAACQAAGKPLLLVKTGRTEAGVKSARSHTASLAGSYDVFEAICRETGVVLARDPDDMVRAANILVRHPGARSPGGVGVYSTSGGGAGIASDRVTEIGLGMAVLSEATRAQLGEILLPPQADNPIDLGGRKAPDSLDITKLAADILLADPAVAYGLVVLTSMPFFAEKTRLIGEVAKASPKPCFLALTPGAAADRPRAALREVDQPYFDRFEDALRAMELVAQFDRLRAEASPMALRPAGLPAIPELPDGVATEGEVKAALAAYGVPVTRESFAATPEAAGKAAAALGFPVVLKAVSRDIAHKSDVGGVALGLRDAGAVAAAAVAMQATVAGHLPQARIDGFSVQEMIKGAAEVIIGARYDPLFGPVVLVGLGGTIVEILKDVAIAPAPVAPERALRMVESLRLAPLLQGARGMPVLDVPAIVDAVVRISWLAHDLGGRLIELEANPLLVRPVGLGLVAVDGRATLVG
ncbi:acetyl-CoA synthetase (ADP-forming) [Humitalea rosea]|uniref:Acetyl-CoA synthetase (ADP-forming) n=1 Tax=Humitalea rosea TaxID=990373 RepID=A0A2W7J1C5_9PROT|nr:acetate--CoA ligase family protein [Humitalea rosea]PZW44773.1 acetyl-CoA synthetase (ADP-forming) [Humitalea rosea]